MLGLGLGFGSPAQATDCLFSTLRWNQEGSAIRFTAGTNLDARTLEVDVTTGRIQCPEPAVHEPSVGQAGRRVVFRDLFGVFEVRLDEDEPRVRTLLFLPHVSRHFLRAYGVDPGGRVLVWTYDRDAAEHSISSLGDTEKTASPQVTSGPEALRFWRSRNAARAFTNAGGRFVRSTCVRSRRGREQMCAETVASSGGAGERFRLTIGRPGDIHVLVTRCAPTALAVAPDSSHVVWGLLENVDGTGRSADLATWVTDWTSGSRLASTSLTRSMNTARRHETWSYWLGTKRLLWADTAGALWHFDLGSSAARPLVSAPQPTEHPTFYRVVADVVNERASAEAALHTLRDRGFEAGLQHVGTRIEIQAGASSNPESARSLVARLQREGFSSASIVQGGAQDIAPGFFFGHVQGPGGRIASLRNVDGIAGRYSEIWVRGVSGSKGSGTRLVGSFEDLGPGAP